MDLLKAACVLTCFILSGCSYYSTQIELLSGDRTAGEVRLQELASFQAVVDAVMKKRGFVLGSQLSDVRQSSLESKEYLHEVVAFYWPGPTASISRRIVVAVLLHKQTGRPSVLIRDLDSSSATPFTIQLEESLSQALAEEFPSLNVRAERWTSGPALGP